MELRELRYFLAVAQELNITKAAEYLYISQPSLSKQMQNLEKEVGKPLFVRSNRRITLTETGMLLKKRAEEILSLYEKTEADLSAPPDDIAGEVLIGGGESWAVRTVARAACAMQRQYPAVRFQFYSGDADAVIEKLEKGLIDFGIVVDLPDLKKYNSMRLPDADRWGVLMRRDSPLAQNDTVTAEELRALPLLCSMQSMQKNSRLIEWLGGSSRGLRIVGQYNLLYNATLLVQSGMGYAICLDNLVNTTGESPLCFKPLDPPLYIHLDIVWKKYTAFSKPAQLFLDFLQRAIAEQTDTAEAKAGCRSEAKK